MFNDMHKKPLCLTFSSRGLKDRSEPMVLNNRKIYPESLLPFSAFHSERIMESIQFIVHSRERRARVRTLQNFRKVRKYHGCEECNHDKKPTKFRSAVHFIYIFVDNSENPKLIQEKYWNLLYHFRFH